MMNKMKALLTEEQGQGMTEYGLVLGVIAIGVVAVLTIFKDQILKMYKTVVTELNGGTPPTGL
jgi:pilus assembly protein Flp/PilA